MDWGQGRFLVVEVDEPRPELDLGRRALVLEDHHVLQDDRPVAQLPRDARVVLQFSYIICHLRNYQRKDSLSSKEGFM